MPTTRRRRSRTFCTSALAPIGRCFLSAGDERRSAWSPRRMTLATMVSPKASVLHATPHGDTWEKPVGLLPFCPPAPTRSVDRAARQHRAKEGLRRLRVRIFWPCPSMRCTSASGPDQSSRSRSTPGFRGWPPSPTATLSRFGPERILLHGIDAPESARALPRPVAEHGFAAPRPPGCFAAASPAGRSSALTATATATATGASSRCAASTAPT